MSPYLVVNTKPKAGAPASGHATPSTLTLPLTFLASSARADTLYTRTKSYHPVLGSVPTLLRQ